MLCTEILHVQCRSVIAFGSDRNKLLEMKYYWLNFKKIQKHAWYKKCTMNRAELSQSAAHSQKHRPSGNRAIISDWISSIHHFTSLAQSSSPVFGRICCDWSYLLLPYIHQRRAQPRQIDYRATEYGVRKLNENRYTVRWDTTRAAPTEIGVFGKENLCQRQFSTYRFRRFVERILEASEVRIC